MVGVRPALRYQPTSRACNQKQPSSPPDRIGPSVTVSRRSEATLPEKDIAGMPGCFEHISYRPIIPQRVRKPRTFAESLLCCNTAFPGGFSERGTLSGGRWKGRLAPKDPSRRRAGRDPQKVDWLVIPVAHCHLAVSSTGTSSPSEKSPAR